MKSKKKIILIAFLLGIILFIFGNKKIVIESKVLVEKIFLVGNEVMPLVDNEAQIEDQTYPTLEEALAVAKNGEEIDLLKNVERTSLIKVLSETNAIIDLNGFSINNTAVTDENNNYSLYISSSNIKLTIKDSGTAGTINGICNNLNCILNIGEKDGNVNTSSPTIKKIDSYSLGKLNFYDGKITGTNDNRLVIDGTETDYKPVNIDGWITLQKSTVKEAKIGEKEYYAIENAISEVRDGETIEILNNIKRDTVLEIRNKIKIELNGKSITSTTVCIVSRKSVTISDKGFTGKIISTGAYGYGMHNEYSTFIIEGGTISGTQAGIQNNGDLTITGGKITGQNYGIYNRGNNSISANVIVTGGEISGERYGIYQINDFSSITIGKKDSIVSTTSPIVSGEQYGVYTNGSGTFNFYDGKIIGNIEPIDLTTVVNDKPDGYEVVVEENTATLQNQHTLKYTVEYYTSNNYKENKEKKETVPITQEKLTVDKNEIKEKTFDGYKFSKITIDEVDYESAEKIPDEVPDGTTIKVYYLREMTVKAEYLDKATGKQIEKDEITNGVEGDSYKTEEKKITGYKFDSIVGKPEGKMQLEQKEDGTEITEILVKYYYTKVENNVLGSLFGNNNSGGENNPVLSNIISGINTGDAIPIIAISVIGIVIIVNVIIIVKRKKNKKE